MSYQSNVSLSTIVSIKGLLSDQKSGKNIIGERVHRVQTLNHVICPSLRMLCAETMISTRSAAVARALKGTTRTAFPRRLITSGPPRKGKLLARGAKGRSYGVLTTMSWCCCPGWAWLDRGLRLQWA